MRNVKLPNILQLESEIFNYQIICSWTVANDTSGWRNEIRAENKNVKKKFRTGTNYTGFERRNYSAKSKKYVALTNMNIGAT